MPSPAYFFEGALSRPPPDGLPVVEGQPARPLPPCEPPPPGGASRRQVFEFRGSPRDSTRTLTVAPGTWMSARRSFGLQGQPEHPRCPSEGANRQIVDLKCRQALRLTDSVIPDTAPSIRRTTDLASALPDQMSTSSRPHAGYAVRRPLMNVVIVGADMLTGAFTLPREIRNAGVPPS